MYLCVHWVVGKNAGLEEELDVKLLDQMHCGGCDGSISVSVSTGGLGGVSGVSSGSSRSRRRLRKEVVQGVVVGRELHLTSPIHMTWSLLPTPSL